MNQYLLAVYQPEGPLPEPGALTDIRREVNTIREEMKRSGAWVFSGGLHAPTSSTVVRRSGPELMLTDGPYLEGKEYLGGFTIVRAADLDGALAWGGRLARATGLPIEVRPFREES